MYWWTRSKSFKQVFPTHVCNRKRVCCRFKKWVVLNTCHAWFVVIQDTAPQVMKKMRCPMTKSREPIQASEFIKQYGISKSYHVLPCVVFYHRLIFMAGLSFYRSQKTWPSNPCLHGLHCFGWDLTIPTPSHMWVGQVLNNPTTHPTLFFWGSSGLSQNGGRLFMAIKWKLYDTVYFVKPGMEWSAVHHAE